MGDFTKKNFEDEDGQQSRHMRKRNRKAKLANMCTLKWTIKATLYRQTFKAIAVRVTSMTCNTFCTSVLIKSFPTALSV